MKRNLFMLALVAALAGGVYAAQSYSRSTYRMVFFGVNPTYTNGSVTPTAVACSAVFKRRYVNDADNTDAEEATQQLNVSFDLLAAPATQVTVAVGGGVTVTHAQLAALLRKASEQAGGL